MPESPVQPLPSGVVSLLFTDVEGSTRLWAANPDAMSASLRVHDDILRQAVETRGGYVFTTAGDSFAVAFSQASAAVEAAIAAQADLDSAPWPGPALRVRMGLHLGEAEERGGDYFGPVVNACARVEATGHGGQVLLSEAIASVVDRDQLVDLGEHQLRDLPEPVRLFQLGAGDFGALRGTVGARDTLPPRRTRLLGRDREITAVRTRFDDARLVTLVGPGGIGKTSLAIEAAGGMSAAFPGGVHFADLAQVNEPDGIVAAMCRAVELTATAAPYQQLRDHLAARDTLVIVDNCEHLIDDVAELVDQLLDDVPSLRLLATSREHLDLDGEHVVTVGPLDAGIDSPAVRLFVERVVAIAPDLSPSADDLQTISNICTRLDGMPLAIELAAGRARTMGLADIERGLNDRFTLLAGSRRGKLRRQQTLRATIDWSIDLLTGDERRLLARLAVISGPFGLDVAVAVAEASRPATADLVASLTAKSLVQRAPDVDGEARFQLLETVREWGLDHLDGSGELRAVRDVHARWHLTQAESLDVVEFVVVTNYVSIMGPVVDPVAAAAHLREHDVIGAALIIGRYGRGIVESGLAPGARDIQREARAAGWTRSACRLWLADAAMIMDLAEGIPFDDPPPADDGTFEWRYLVGGRNHENAGLAGWYRTWTEPGSLIDEARVLPPVADDREALLIRAFAISNLAQALANLGHFEAAIEAYDESARLWERARSPRASIATEITAVVTAAVVLGVDQRDSPANLETRRGLTAASTSLARLACAVIFEAPEERRRAVAQAARDHCDGRYPTDESAYLAVLAYYALDDDPGRAASLVETAGPRTPGTLPLKRLVQLRAAGEPLELMGDQSHHLAALFAEAVPPEQQPARTAANRRKLDEEVARILD